MLVADKSRRVDSRESIPVPLSVNLLTAPEHSIARVLEEADMQIKSMAGDFEIAVERFETEGDHLVMVGKMGVWEARTYISPRELFSTIGMALRCRALWLYLLRAPFALRQSKNENEGQYQ